MKRTFSIAIGTCIALLFICSVLINLGAEVNQATNLADAVRPYFNAIGQEPDEIFPGIITRFQWGLEDPIVLIAKYELDTGWRVIAFYQDQKETVPSEWTLLWALAMKKWRDKELPTDPWGQPITDMNILRPEQRW